MSELNPENSLIFDRFSQASYPPSGYYEEAEEGEEEKEEGEGGFDHYYEEDTPEDKGDDLWSVDSKGIYRIYDLLKTASELPDDVVSARSLASREDGDEVRYSTTLGVPGVVRVDLSPLTQKICGCVIDENVTTEFPWVYVDKLIIEDNLELHSESSDFLPVRNQIESYPEHQVLIGYAPHLDYEGQFYVCVTKQGHDEVARRIEQTRQEQQERVRQAIYKEPAKWLSQGSERDIDDTIARKSRPLYCLEVNTTVAQLKAPSDLVDRTPEMQRDGYVELVPYRETYDNVYSSLIDNATKVGPETNDHQVQTSAVMQVNAASQCILDREPMDDLPTVKMKNLSIFLKSRLDEVVKVLEDNQVWDVYANDYAKLVPKGYTMYQISEYTEEESYNDGKIGRGVISDLSWHPTRTGLAACAYSRRGLLHHHHKKNKATEQFEQTGQVLLWGLDDNLKPKLILESEKPVERVSFCPWNYNILIGGCVNGQIVVWDLTDRLEEIENVGIRTSTELDGDANLIQVKNNKPPTATSASPKSQKDCITKIEWVPAHSHVDQEGNIQELSADAKPEDYSMQFLTSSLDGTIAIWDLKWIPPPESEGLVNQRKKKQMFDVPEAPKKENDDPSAYKRLDEKFRPFYMLHFFEASDDSTKKKPVSLAALTKNPVAVTAMSVRQPIVDYHSVTSARHRGGKDAVFIKSHIAQRKVYKVTVKKDPVPFDGIFVGTSTAECGFVTWDGYTYITGDETNTETAKWSWRCSGIHDGPITDATRARHLRDVVVAIGGNILSIWREDFGEPIFWRRSRIKYTSCDWSGMKPNVLLLGRQDGVVEIWDLFVKDHEPTSTQGISTKIVAGIYTHKLPMNPHCVAFCDYHSDLRMFLTPRNLTTYEKNDVALVRQLIDGEVKRINEYNLWKKKLEVERAEQEADEQSDHDSKKKLVVEVKPKPKVKSKKARTYQQRLDELQKKWVTRELNRMQTVILSKKNLQGKNLEEQNAPILQMKKAAREKEARRKRILNGAEEFFEQAVKSNFPVLSETLFPSLEGEGGKKNSNDLLVLPKIHTLDRIEYLKKTPDEIYQEYEEMEKQLLRKMRQSTVKPTKLPGIDLKLDKPKK